MCAISAFDRIGVSMSDIASYWREQTRKRRLRARELGLCVICMSAQARPGRKTCARCCAAATAATQKRRELRRQTPIDIV
jgi:hypothetical protein